LQSVIRSVQKRSVTAGWTAHDLRRTVRTGLSQCGVRPDVAEFVLGHKVGGVRGIYDRYEPLAEAAAALESWASRLRLTTDPDRFVQTDGVVVLPFAK